MIIIIGVLIVLLASLFVLQQIFRAREDYLFHSDMSSVNALIRDKLKHYFEQESRYPDSLKELTESIIKNSYSERDAPDNSKELELLLNFDYFSDGMTYSITWSASHHGIDHTHKEYGNDGDLVKTEYYINGNLSSVHEFGDKSK